MNTPILDPHTMKRLAFIRLLHQQAIEQSRAPEPLAFASVLTFHDCVELFLILTSEHLGITVKDHGRFIDRYWDGLHPSKHPNGVDLSGKLGIKRLTDLRNSFKHSAGMAGTVAIEQARVDTTGFLEDNTPKVFNVDYAAIDLADVVPQAAARDKIKASAAAEASGDRGEAMALLVEAFDDLFQEHLRGGYSYPTPFSFGREVNRPMSGNSIAGVLRDLQGRSNRTPTRGVERLGEQIEEVTKAVSALQVGLRVLTLGVLTLGVEYHRYYRFTQLTPNVSWMGGGNRRRFFLPGYDPSRAEYDYCQKFVIDVALRAADMEAHIAPPSWQAERNW